MASISSSHQLCLAVIPARAGSKRVPGKNIRELCGKPIIAYTVEAAIQSNVFSRVVVSTDSEEIANVSVRVGAEVPFLRPKEVAQNQSVIEDAILDALKRLKQSGGYKPDVIVLLHPTTPLRTTTHIDESIALLLEKQADAVVSVSEPMEHPGDMVYWDSQGKMHFLLDTDFGKGQRQQYPKYFFLNGVVYVFTRENLLQNKSRFGKKTIPYVMRKIDSIDIDSMDDLLIAEAILMRRKALVSEK